MWIIVQFIDDYVAAVPITWIMNCDGQIQCYWPLQDERRKRSGNETPISFEMNEWNVYDCVVLLDGAIYTDFEEALAIEMGDIDNDASDRPKLSWKNAEKNTEVIITNNTKSDNLTEISLANKDDISFSEFAAFLDDRDLCSSMKCLDSNRIDVQKANQFSTPSVESEELSPAIQVKSDVDMLDAIIENQKEKKKGLAKMMARMYSLESAVGYHHI